jgi:hypothetical protein
LCQGDRRRFEAACVTINLLKFVEPKPDRKKVAQIKNQLCGQYRFRDLSLFVVGEFNWNWR